MLDTFARECGLQRGDIVADVGSGTGISKGPLLGRGFEVYAVEPNDAMLAAAEEEYGGNWVV